jgi:hypothetical protein
MGFTICDGREAQLCGRESKLLISTVFCDRYNATDPERGAERPESRKQRSPNAVLLKNAPAR